MLLFFFGPTWSLLDPAFVARGIEGQSPTSLYDSQHFHHHTKTIAARVLRSRTSITEARVQCS